MRYRPKYLKFSIKIATILILALTVTYSISPEIIDNIANYLMGLDGKQILKLINTASLAGIALLLIKTMVHDNKFKTTIKGIRSIPESEHGFREYTGPDGVYYFGYDDDELVEELTNEVVSEDTPEETDNSEERTEETTEEGHGLRNIQIVNKPDNEVNKGSKEMSEDSLL